MNYQNPYAIGSIIRELRINGRMTQSKLAEGICTQAEISRIENGLAIPYADVLQKIALRLGVTVEFFFDRIGDTNPSYVQDTYLVVRNLVQKNAYEELYKFVSKELRNPAFSAPKHQEFLLWHLGMSSFYAFNNLDHSIDLLEAALSINSTEQHRTEQQIQIRNTLANILSDTGRIPEAIVLFETCTKMLKELPLLIDHTLPVRITYNLARALSKSKEDEKAITLCRSGIKQALKLQSLYLLGELYFQLGYSYGAVGEFVQCYTALNTAATLFELSDNQIYIEHTTNIVKKYSDIEKRGTSS